MSTAKAHLEVLPGSVKLVLGLGLTALAAFPLIGTDFYTQMVTRILKLTEEPRPADAADALALAICHTWRGGTEIRYAAAAARAGGPR